MPAPSGSSLKSLIEQKMGPKVTQSPYFQRFLASLSDEISLKWTMWIASMAWGGNTVNGAGIGSWSGIGNGGKIHGSPFTISVDAVFDNAGFKIKTVATKKFLEGLNTILGKKFDIWIGSFTCTANMYSGTCGATPVSPGPFSAQSIPVPLLALGMGDNPANIQKEWEDILTAAPDPIFRLDNPNCYTRLFTSAVSSTIEEQFVQFFLATSMATGDSVQGTGAPGSGTGSSKSTAAGKVI